MMQVQLTKKGDNELQSISQSICIKLLKQFAFEHLVVNNPLREILLSEKDELDVFDFIVKMEIWFRLLSWRDK
tara:strand:- start:948 stop:1166 length:219 start_codon:yes stop_codon:yes gene_type:complete